MPIRITRAAEPQGTVTHWILECWSAEMIEFEEILCGEERDKRAYAEQSTHC